MKIILPNWISCVPCLLFANLETRISFSVSKQA